MHADILISIEDKLDNVRTNIQMAFSEIIQL